METIWKTFTYWSFLKSEDAILYPRAITKTEIVAVGTIVNFSMNMTIQVKDANLLHLTDKTSSIENGIVHRMLPEVDYLVDANCYVMVTSFRLID